jgi:cytochrome c-type biogenesis protein CcmH
MVLLAVLALMTVVAALAVLLPLMRSRQVPPSGSDVAVYRDQLEEIERDLAAGLIREAEAEAARVEVSRRLLAAAEPAAGDAGGARWGRHATAAAALLVLPLGAAGVYLTFGSPGLSSQPLASRSTPAPAQSIEALVAHVEQRLASNPDDGRGWEVVAPVYLRMGRYEDAVRARRNALRLLGPTAGREADLGEALVAAADGSVTPEARAAFARAAALDANNVAAGYYLGLAAAQAGEREQALAAWRKLLADAPEGAPWVGFVEAAISRIGGPAAAPDGNYNEMVLGMVARLAERLKTDGTDVDGWVRLVRSYKVLGDEGKAKAAAEDGRRALAGDPDKVRRLDEAVKELGLKG